MKIKIINAKIITLNNKNAVYENGEIFINDNIIEYVGKTRQTTYTADKVIDANGNIIMPGFINTHCHAGMSLLRGVGENADFSNWWYDYIRPIESKMTSNDYYNGNMLSIYEMIKNGITTFVDCYFGPEQCLKAVKNTGIRAVIGIGATDGEEILNEKHLDKQMELISSCELVTPVVYVHGVYTCDEFKYSEAVSFAKKHNLVIMTHSSETLNEVGDCFNKTNMTPIGLLESYGFFDCKCVLAHCVHCDKDDVEIMKNYDLSVSSNPSSNLYLGSGIAPIYSFVNNGINVCIGTDGPASNNSLDMFKEMFLIDNLQSGVLNQADAINTLQTIKFATINGANAFNLKNLGMLEVGYLADLIMIDVHSANMQPIHNLYNNIVNACSNSNVILTMVNGKILYENGNFNMDMPLDVVIKNANNSIEKIIKKM